MSGWELSPLCAYVYPSTLALRTASSWLPSREETGCSRSLLQLSPLIVCTIPKAAWEGSSIGLLCPRASAFCVFSVLV